MDDIYEILCHALGLDRCGRGHSDRNHFVTGEGSTDHSLCMQATEHGLMTRRDGSFLTGGDDLFTVTDAGRVFVRENKPEVPQATRAQRRYQRYLEADSGLSFGDWLKRGGLSCSA